MSTADQSREERDLPEKTLYLAMVAAPPALFITHFVVAYALASVWCAKMAGADGRLGGAVLPFVAITVAALGGVLWVGWHGYRRHSFGSEAVPHDMDTPGDRHRFLGFSTFLLAALSAIATIFAALVVVFFEDCR